MLISSHKNTTSHKRRLPMSETRCPPRSTAGKIGVPESALLKRAKCADFQITIVAESLEEIEACLQETKSRGDNSDC
jgi:hypothetical protein